MEMGTSSLLNLARLRPDIRSRRWSSYDKTGGNADRWLIPAGETALLGEMAGAGCIRHIWMTTTEDHNNLRGLVLRIYWDGEEQPSVACPVGDFFGLGHAKATYFQSLPLQSFYLGMNCWFPMPYANGARLTVTNDSPYDSFLYFYVDYQEWPPARRLGRFPRLLAAAVGAPRPGSAGPSRRRRGGTEHQRDDNYLVWILTARANTWAAASTSDPTSPVGGARATTCFCDGESGRRHSTAPAPRTILRRLELQQAGAAHHRDPNSAITTRAKRDYTGKAIQYRFHVEDPVYFTRSLRFSIEHGHANDRQGDWTSTAYWYALGRTLPLPEIPPFDDRVPYAFGGLERWPGKDRHELPY